MIWFCDYCKSNMGEDTIHDVICPYCKGPNPRHAKNRRIHYENGLLVDEDDKFNIEKYIRDIINENRR